LKPKLEKILADLKDGVTGKGYDGEYSSDEKDDRRLNLGFELKKVKTKARKMHYMPMDDVYYTKLAMRNSNMRKSTASNILRASPLSEVQYRRLASANLATGSQVTNQSMQKANTNTQVNHNVKKTFHTDNFNRNRSSADGFQHESQQVSNVVKTQVEESHVSQNIVQAVSNAVVAEQGAQIQVDDGDHDEEESVSRNLRSHDISWSQNDNVDFDMTKIYGANKLTLSTVKEKDIDDMANTDPRTLIKQAQDIIQKDATAAWSNMLQVMNTLVVAALLLTIN